MADAVTTIITRQDDQRYQIHLTNASDGTGESAVAKATPSGLLIPVAGSPGTTAAPVSVDIESVRWSIQGFTSVKLAWNHTAPDTAMLLTGSGYEDFEPGLLKDPRSAGGTGALQLTTAGATATSTYDITLVLVKRP
jgi:hypothetical protein